MSVAETEPAATEQDEAAEEPKAEEPKLSTEQKMAVARTARAFASYGEAKKAMAKIAKSIVNLRLTFEKDGRPDFRGETPQYRGAIASLYESAIPDPDERNSFKVAIRYWVGKEFDARVKAGELDRDVLEAVGIMGRESENGDRPATPTTREPRRAATPADLTPTGVVAEGRELTPPEVLVEAERIAAEHITDESLGPVMVLQSIARELGPVVAGLRNPEFRDKLPGRALTTSIEQLLILTLDAAHLSGVEVEEFVASWLATMESTSDATTAEVVAASA